uniref:phosphoinositide phospholipase C n=1 Tax=viral metagenome TaxID=1070528 RepID=A0A6C0HN26_9ZZZZ
MNTVKTKLTSIKDTITTTIDNNNNLKYYLIIITPVLIFLLYLLFKYSFSQRTATQITLLDYHQKIKPVNLPQCADLDHIYRFTLCDYYISASYMTPCVGNLHYDYISLDMIKTVLISGARYIQIPICTDSVSAQANPIIATAVYGTQLITSLNTLSVIDVLTTIYSYAFVNPSIYNSSSTIDVSNDTINYPLIVHLILNTNNTYTLNQLSNNIKQLLGNVLVSPEKYITTPIWFEQVCKLLNKIIIIATPEYLGSQLEDIIVPTTSLFQTFYQGDIAKFTKPSTATSATLTGQYLSGNGAITPPTTKPNTTLPDAYYHTYLKRLSEKQQTKNAVIFNTKYPSFDAIISEDLDTIGTTILSDTSLLNPLVCFNKVGISVVTPMNIADVLAINYDPAEPFMDGCQCVAMNFQVNDINMQNYIKIFKTSSYRLKPTSLRYSETASSATAPQNLSLYAPAPGISYNILPQLVTKYTNQLIALQSYSLPTTYITQIGQNLIFKVLQNAESIPATLNSTLDLPYTITTAYNTQSAGKPSANQCFRVCISTLSGPNACINLESISMPGYYITLSGQGGSTNLQTLSTSTATLKTQTFYLTAPKKIDSSTDLEQISLRNIDDSNVKFLAFQSKNLVALPDTNTDAANSAMTFAIMPVNFQYIATITTIDGNSIFTSGSVVGVKLGDSSSSIAVPYILIAAPQSSQSSQSSFPNIPFILKNPNTGNILTMDGNTKLLMDNSSIQTANSIITAKHTQGFYTLLIGGQVLTQMDSGKLQFTNIPGPTNDADASNRPNIIVSYTSNYLFNINLTYNIL